MQVINEIFNNVQNIPHVDYPGTILAFGSDVYPVLAVDPCHVLFCAAQYGNGRVFVVSHEEYLSKMLANDSEHTVLWENIKRWVSNGRNVDNSCIFNIASYNSVYDVPIVNGIAYWTGHKNRNQIFIHELLDYISNGGSLICGICPWGWMTLTNRTLEDMSLNKFLISIGMCFKSNYCELKSRKFSISQNNADFAHFGKAFNKVLNDTNQAPYNRDIIRNGLFELPKPLAIEYANFLQKTLHKYILELYKPTYSKGVVSLIGRAMLSLCSAAYTTLGIHGVQIKAQNIREFPGDYPNGSLPKCMAGAVTIKSKFDEWHCTGYYLPAGQLMKLTVLEGSPFGWELRIGVHSIDLSNCKMLQRWPVVNTTVRLKRVMEISSAFGGIVYLESPKGNSTIKVRFENVIEIPYYDLRKPETMSQWFIKKEAPGLWAELCGLHVVLTVPAWSVKNIQDPSAFMRFWDSVVVANHELRGTDVNNSWRERIVVDVQQIQGHLHAGYPITVPFDMIQPDSPCSLFNADKIKDGITHWNLFHELAHNMQRDRWTTRLNYEVIPNVYVLHVLNLVCNQFPSIDQIFSTKLYEKQLNDFASKDFPIKELQTNPYIGLLIYVQLIDTFGWDCFKTLFREYESLTDSDLLLTNDILKTDEWIIRLSKIVDLNISPLFYFWNIPMSETVNQKLTGLSNWLPNDKITQAYPNRVEFVKQKYKNTIIGQETIFGVFTKFIYPKDFNLDSNKKLNELNNFT